MPPRYPLITCQPAVSLTSIPTLATSRLPSSFLTLLLFPFLCFFPGVFFFLHFFLHFLSLVTAIRDPRLLHSFLHFLLSSLPFLQCVILLLFFIPSLLHFLRFLPSLYFLLDSSFSSSSFSKRTLRILLIPKNLHYLPSCTPPFPIPSHSTSSFSIIYSCIHITCLYTLP